MSGAVNDRPPNFRDGRGRFYLVRCFVCDDGIRGRENWGPAVAEGRCAWCGADTGACSNDNDEEGPAV